jgi:hypothetical protein
MTFDKNQLNCEILTKFKSSLVCTIHGHDIIPTDRNKIEFHGFIPKKEDIEERKVVTIGAYLSNSFKNINLGNSNTDENRRDSKDAQLDIVSGIRLGEWHRRGYYDRDKDSDKILAKLGIKYVDGYSKYTDEEVPSKTSLIIIRNNKDAFGGGSVFITKALIASEQNLQPEIVDLMDNLSKGDIGPEPRDTDIKFEDFKMNWYPEGSSSYNGSRYQQVELSKGTNLLAVREANSWRYNKALDKQVSTHNNLIFDKLRIKI